MKQFSTLVQSEDTMVLFFFNGTILFIGVVGVMVLKHVLTGPKMSVKVMFHMAGGRSY